MHMAATVLCWPSTFVSHVSCKPATWYTMPNQRRPYSSALASQAAMHNLGQNNINCVVLSLLIEQAVGVQPYTHTRLYAIRFGSSRSISRRFARVNRILRVGHQRQQQHRQTNSRASVRQGAAQHSESVFSFQMVTYLPTNFEQHCSAFRVLSNWF